MRNINKNVSFFHLFKPSEKSLRDLLPGEGVTFGPFVVRCGTVNLGRRYYIDSINRENDWIASLKDMQRLADWIREEKK